MRGVESDLEVFMSIKMSVSVVIFTFLSASVITFTIMFRYIIGPFKKLKRGEQVIIAMSFVGIISVISFAVIQLLLRILV